MGYQIMTDFQRENRYSVIKHSQLTETQIGFLKNCIHGEGIPTVKAVVVESDWPEYELVWQMIEARVVGEPTVNEHVQAHLSQQIDIERITSYGLRTQLAEHDKMLAEFAAGLTLAITDHQVRAAMTQVGRTKCMELLQRYNQREAN